MPLRASEPKRIVVAGEDRTHRFLATRLFDAVAAQHVGVDNLPFFRTFVGLEPGTEFYDTRHAKADAIARKLRTTGRLEGRTRSPESIQFTRVWLLSHGADGLVMLKDSDNDASLLVDARRMNDAFASVPPASTFGVPHRDAEGWLVAGYAPSDPEIRRRLERASAALSFNPTREPERLTAQPNDADTDAKRVCVFLRRGGSGLRGKGRATSRPLTEDELDEWAPSLAPLERLAAFEACGLTAFIDGLRAMVRRLAA